MDESEWLKPSWKLAGDRAEAVLADLQAAWGDGREVYRAGSVYASREPDLLSILREAVR